MKVRSVPETTELPDLDPPVPEPEPAAAPRTGALVIAADARNLRERSEARNLLPDARTRSDKRRQLGFSGGPTMAFYAGLDPPAPEPAAAPRSGALVKVADANSLREFSEDRVALSRVRRDDRRQLGFAGVPTMAFYS
jgi:hypothetical protein